MIDYGNWGLKNSKLLYFLVVILIVGGVISIKQMGKLEDPEIIVKQALVVTLYPGASAHQVELEVTDPLEKAIRSIKNVDFVESRSMNDLSVITVNLSTLVHNNQVEDMWTLLRRKVSDTQPQLPEGAHPSMVRDDFGDVMGMFYALTSDGYSYKEMSDYAQLIKREILEIEGVSQVVIYGEQEESINIELFEDKLANLGITPAEVLSTLSGQNKTLYSGYYDAGGMRLRVSVSDKYRNVEDIANLLLRGHQGDLFRLKDIAKIYKEYDSPVRNELSYDNQSALGIAISALTEADITQVGKKIEALITQLESSRLPAGMELHKVFFQPDRVNNALNTFVINLIESVVIVIVLLIFFMGLRSGVIIGLNLVIIVLGSILVLNFAGGTLQRVSLASFVLAMGMLVDNAIVIVDGILIDLQKGVPRERALVNIGQKTAMPLLGATLIAILAFFPIFLSPDTAGIYVRDLFIVLAVSLLLSWILALVYVPIQAKRLLKVKGRNKMHEGTVGHENAVGHQGAARAESIAEHVSTLGHEGAVGHEDAARCESTTRSEGIAENVSTLGHEGAVGHQGAARAESIAEHEIAISNKSATSSGNKSITGSDNSANNKDPYDNRWYRALREVLSWTLRHRGVTIAGAFLLLFASLACYQFLPQGFFPDMDYDQLYIEYKLPEGRSSSVVKQDLQEISTYLLSRKEVTHVTTSVGGTPARYNLVRSMGDPSLSYGELIVDYTSSKELVETMEEIQNYLTQNYPDAYVRMKRYNLMYKKFPIEVQFNGPDPAVLRSLTSQAMAIMEGSPAVTLVRSDWEPQVPVLKVNYNQPIARSVGKSRQDVALSLLSATDGIPTSIYYNGNHKEKIYLKSVNSKGEAIEALENTTIFGMIPSLSSINKEMLYGLFTGAYSQEDILAELLSTIPLSQVADGIKLEWEEPLVIRYNGQRAMRAQGNPAPGYETEDARQMILSQIESIELPQGYSMLWQGEYNASSMAKKYLFKYFPVAIILMVAILIMLFKDYRKPIIIFCCIPLILIGVIFGMLLSGKTFGFVAIVGILGLIGMLIKNGIVLMDEISYQLKDGVDPIEALLNSSQSRFRPVMMASLTTILGMIPLLGDDLFGSLAVTIMGGLLVGTLITLLIIPTLYSLFFKIDCRR